MIKVLIVDDEFYSRKGISKVIPWKNFGCEVCGEADNAYDAIDIAISEKPEIIITDINMPEMDGLEMAKNIREKNPHTKFIVITGYDDFNYARGAIKINALDFLLKPVDIDELKAAIEKCTESIIKDKETSLFAKEKKLIGILRGEEKIEKIKDFFKEEDSVALALINNDDFETDLKSKEESEYIKINSFIDNWINENMRGCLAYDCFGAGQKVTQYCYPDVTWKTHPEKANEIFKVFLIIFQLHQMEWYLLESLSLIKDKQLQAKIETLISENEQITYQYSDEILQFDIEKYRSKANQVLKKVSSIITTDSAYKAHSKECFGRNFKKANLNAKDFSMALMIAANLEGCSLQGTNFLGTDMRDANIKNTDLSSCVFLTQMQINSAKGNSNTKLPKNLSQPISWQGL